MDPRPVREEDARAEVDRVPKRKSIHLTRPAAARVFVSIKDAAIMLDTTEVALRARARRLAKRVGNELVAHLGAGVIAVKMGSNWRFRFSDIG